jgi:transposase
MAAPRSLDLRERAVAAGVSRAQAAAHYQVSHSSAIRRGQTPDRDGQSGGVADGR